MSHPNSNFFRPILTSNPDEPLLSSSYSILHADNHEPSPLLFTLRYHHLLPRCCNRSGLQVATCSDTRDIERSCFMTERRNVPCDGCGSHRQTPDVNVNVPPS